MALHPEVIGGGSVAVGDQQTDYELVQLTRADGRATFVQWVRPLLADRGHASVVVQTEPYAATPWSGDAVDAAFAAASARADGLYNDSACSDVNTRGIAYYPSDASTAAAGTVLHLLNGHGALIAYGRYYACDDVDSEILDMRAALAFLATRPEEIDPQRVAITGNSWGGFLALYGAMHAPAGVNVSVVVPLNPPSVLGPFLEAIDALADTYPQPDALRFFDSYRARVEAATGGPPGTGDFTPFALPAICAGLAGKHTLLLHDTWDTLVPFVGSADIVATCGASVDVQGVWWQRQGPVDYAQVGLDHGLLGREPGYPSVFTLAGSYLYAHFNDAAHPMVGAAARGALAAFLQLVHDTQAAGGDVEHARIRVLEAAAPGAALFLVDENVGAAADTVWAEAVNAVWGTSFDGPQLRAQLASGFPAP